MAMTDDVAVDDARLFSIDGETKQWSHARLGAGLMTYGPK